MAEIVRGYDEWAEHRVCWVEWVNNDGFPRERYFKTRKQAERFALEVEKELLESITQFNEAWIQRAPQEKRRFRESLNVAKKDLLLDAHAGKRSR